MGGGRGDPRKCCCSAVCYYQKNFRQARTHKASCMPFLFKCGTCRQTRFPRAWRSLIVRREQTHTRLSLPIPHWSTWRTSSWKITSSHSVRRFAVLRESEWRGQKKKLSFTFCLSFSHRLRTQVCAWGSNAPRSWGELLFLGLVHPRNCSNLIRFYFDAGIRLATRHIDLIMHSWLYDFLLASCSFGIFTVGAILYIEIQLQLSTSHLSS